MRRRRWTEARIQRELFGFLTSKGHEYICPNCGVFCWEADMVSVTTSGYGHEYEIKIDRSDFFADAKKRKHKQFCTPLHPRRKYFGPVCFWYVVPAGLISPEELPAHAGLIEVYANRGPEIIIKAPRLHSERASKDQLRYIARGLMFRFWKERAHGKNNSTR